MPVEVKGALTARKALKQINPDLAKESQKEINGLMRTITAKAKGYLPSETPMSGWVNNDGQGRWATRGFDRSQMLRGITASTAPTRPNRRGFRSVATIFNKGAAGAIYETAGRLSGIKGNFTPKLGGELKGKDKMKGRLIFRAWDEDNGKVQARVVKAIQTSVDRAMRGGK
jgi:hypothetical protein